MKEGRLTEFLIAHVSQEEVLDIIKSLENKTTGPASIPIKLLKLWAYGVVVNMFDFHRSDRGSNPGRGGKIS